MGFEKESLKLERFVKETIFPAFDELRENRYFETFIDEGSTFVFDGKTYQGFDGFSDWLNSMREILEVNGLDHTVYDFLAEQVDKNRYRVSFQVDTVGKMKDGSDFNITVSEEWTLRREGEAYIFESYLTK